jgi:hypothetical protein
MNLGIFDHLMTLILVVALPIHAVLEHRRLERQVSAGVSGARAQTYYITLVVEWILVAAVLAFWLPGGRTLADLGLGFNVTLGWWIGAGAAIVVITLTIYQTFSTIRNSEALAKIRKQVEPLRALIPHSAKEGRKGRTTFQCSFSHRRHMRRIVVPRFSDRVLRYLRRHLAGRCAVIYRIRLRAHVPRQNWHR